MIQSRIGFSDEDSDVKRAAEFVPASHVRCQNAYEYLESIQNLKGNLKRIRYECDTTHLILILFYVITNQNRSHSHSEMGKNFCGIKKDCFYATVFAFRDIYYLEEVQKKIEQSKPEQAFWAVLDKIQFEKTYTINIMEKFGFGRESGPAHIIVNVESCLTLANFNLSLCPPPPPANVRVENETASSFWIAWDGFYDQNSISQISYYNITVDRYLNVNNPGIYRASKPLFKSSVPGNQTRIEVKNITGPQSIKILVVAKSIGGMSEPSEGRAVVHFLKDDVPWTKSLEKFWMVIVIVVILLMTIVVILYLKSFRDRLHRNKEKKEMWKKWDEETPTPHVDRYPTKWEIDFGNLVLHDVVGKGQFGEVRKATLYRKGGKTTVAVKTLRVQPDTTSDDDETEDGSLAKDIIDKFFREEFEILMGIEPHQHVVGLVGLVREPTPALVVQFCDGGDLQTHLRKAAPVKVDRKRSSPVPSMMGSMVQLQSNAEVRVQLSMVTNEAYFIKTNDDIGCSVSPLDLLSYARQVACGMEFLSNNKIIHRDLAARNILIKFDGPEKNRVLKIADFGLSRDVYEQNWYKKRSKGKIPVKWLAIECLLKEVYTIKSDVWSYGVLLWEIVTFGATPYPGIDNVRMYDVLKDGYRMTKPENCSKELFDLMTQCWDEDPDARPDFTTIRRKIEELIGNCGDAANYLNLDSTGTIQYSELMEPLRIDALI
ncbi:Proto-oncogene tyrosine-protein kinase receptor Ret [Folsomia candida]|uniref:receptor protein-tyrosine kinase n=1 Tax=Folsomia candida TaxID=158441 RepID=A0A226EJW1_FOLCA|nr:Proto-oncogene tyrosine-protein kinase receptor Ret [Folsomia candida]